MTPWPIASSGKSVYLIYDVLNILIVYSKTSYINVHGKTSHDWYVVKGCVLGVVEV